MESNHVHIDKYTPNAQEGRNPRQMSGIIPMVYELLATYVPETSQ